MKTKTHSLPRPNRTIRPPHSNFTIRCISIRQLESGGIERTVELENEHGEKCTAHPRGEVLADCAKFRAWLLNQGNFCWGGHFDDLTSLHHALAKGFAGIKATPPEPYKPMVFKRPAVPLNADELVARLITAYRGKQIGDDLVRYERRKENGILWFVMPDAAAKLQNLMAKQGDLTTFSFSAVRAQVVKRPYWVGTKKKRFSNGVFHAWGIDYAKHPVNAARSQIVNPKS